MGADLLHREEYCPGQTLADWLEQRTEPVLRAPAAMLVATLAGAVDYAPRHGIIHRDLKPSNVMLVPKSVGGMLSHPAAKTTGSTLFRRSPTSGWPSCWRRAGETRSGLILGTPGYMAPEQVEGRLGAIGPQTDVHALGVILYEMLTARPPFSGATDVEMSETRRPG